MKEAASLQFFSTHYDVIAFIWGFPILSYNYLVVGVWWFSGPTKFWNHYPCPKSTNHETFKAQNERKKEGGNNFFLFFSRLDQLWVKDNLHFIFNYFDARKTHVIIPLFILRFKTVAGIEIVNKFIFMQYISALFTTVFLCL